MSEENRGHETSMLASMFGFVTEEDRDRWDRVRQAQKTSGAGKAGAKGTMDSLVRNVERQTTSQMRAVDQARVNEQFENSTNKSRTQRWNSQQQRIEDVVDSTPRDSREDLDPDFDFEA